MVKDVGSKNNGVINDDVDKEKLENYKKSLNGLDGYLKEKASDDLFYLNGTKEISLSDIQLIPILNACAIHSENAFKINIINDKSDYPNLGKFLNNVYKQQFWIDNSFKPEDSYELWRDKFGLNSSDGKYGAVEEKEDEKENTGFYKIPDSRETLYDYLCAAMSLELSTLPLYLTAMYSFVDELSDTAKATQKLIREVMMDEMLHMNLVNNVVASIYGVSKATTKFNIPYGKGCKLPAGIRDDITEVQLRPFSKEVLYDAFIQIEAPTSLAKEHQPVKCGML